MNLILLSAVIAVTGLLTGLASAADGTITINGNVTAESCLVSVDGQGIDATINLADVADVDINIIGDIAGFRPFTIQLTACPNVTSVRARFEPINVDPIEGNLANTIPAASGGAQNVQVQITNGEGVPINLLINDEPNIFEHIDNGNATLNYAAQYYASKSGATAGLFSSQLLYTLDYR